MAGASAERRDNSCCTTDILRWQALLCPAIEGLRELAGTTEAEFLALGAQVQDLHLRSSRIVTMSDDLVALFSGERVNALTERLHRMMSDLEAYVAEERERSSASLLVLEDVRRKLESLAEPLEGFHKMDKLLRILGISTKIESSRIGEMGAGFINLALDVEKLSRRVNEKSAGILLYRQQLIRLIDSSLASVRSSDAAHGAGIGSSLRTTSSALRELVSVNERCSQFGEMVSGISADVTESIGEAVSSIQMHDVTRQQMEHIVEALEGLVSDTGSLEKGEEGMETMQLLPRFGDVCELQEAQLRFASAEFHTAVCSIVDSLRSVAQRQVVMAEGSKKITDVDGSKGTTFVDVIGEGMKAITGALAVCASADGEMSRVTENVVRTIGEIATFVTEIEAIGSEIELIALNAQIRAAHTGETGAALGVLAEAINRLSDDAASRTSLVAETLHSLNQDTARISDTDQEGHLRARVELMQEETDDVLHALREINEEMFSALRGLNGEVAALTEDVDKATAGIDVHVRAKKMSEDVLTVLHDVVFEVRRIVPASSTFKENLRHMEGRYTMESERRIHLSLANGNNGRIRQAGSAVPGTNGGDSGFGDNVDLF